MKGRMEDGEMGKCSNRRESEKGNGRRTRGRDKVSLTKRRKGKERGEGKRMRGDIR